MKLKLAALGLTAVLALAACGGTTPPSTGGGTTANVTFTLPAAGTDYTYVVTDASTGAVVKSNADDSNSDPAAVQLDGLAAGSYNVTFSKSGFQDLTIQLTVNTDGTFSFSKDPSTIQLQPVTGGGGDGVIVTDMSGDIYLRSDTGTDASTGTPITVAKGGKFYAIVYARDAAKANENAKVQLNLPAGLTVGNVGAKYTTSAAAGGDAPFPYGTGANPMDAMYDAANKNVSATVANLGANFQLTLAAEINVAADAQTGKYCFTSPNIPSEVNAPTDLNSGDANLRCVNVQ